MSLSAPKTGYNFFCIFLVVIFSIFLLIPVPSFSQQSDAFDVLQKGHKANREGNLERAVTFYKKALKIKPNYSAAKSSLKSALRLKSISDVAKKIAPGCIKSSSTPENNRCAQKFFFWNGQPIHPLIIMDMVTLLSDEGDQVIAINLEHSQGSNRYCCEDSYNVTVKNGLMRVEYRRPSKDGLNEGSFIYRLEGKTDNGVHVVRTWDNGGGSGIFSSLMFLRITERKGLRLKGESLLALNKDQIVLEKLGELGLGDRKRHDIGVDENFLFLDGNKIRITLD